MRHEFGGKIQGRHGKAVDRDAAPLALTVFHDKHFVSPLTAAQTEAFAL
jgi:hypothetical protein